MRVIRSIHLSEVIVATRPPKDQAGVRVVRRHHLLVRWSHRLNVPVLLGLILSGVSTYWASPVHQDKPDPLNIADALREANGAPGEGKPLLDFSDWASD
jgi:hypothetical protein